MSNSALTTFAIYFDIELKTSCFVCLFKKIFDRRGCSHKNGLLKGSKPPLSLAGLQPKQRVNATSVALL